MDLDFSIKGFFKLLHLGFLHCNIKITSIYNIPRLNMFLCAWANYKKDKNIPFIGLKRTPPIN